tara:strand:- start:6463 stop:6708 length:246 start_codon:yes stop_codon:yes gene_type:complete
MKKPGWKTTEFWLSLLTILIGAITTSGAISNNTVLQGLGLAATALGALGYSGARAVTKAGESKENAIKHMLFNNDFSDPKQ